MKKYFLSMMSILMMALVSVSFVACGDDDDDNGGSYSGSASSGTSKMDMGELNVDVNHCFWAYDTEDNENVYVVDLYNLDIEAYAKQGRHFYNADMVQILIKDNNGSNASLPTGTFKDFTMQITRGVSSNLKALDNVIMYFCEPDSTGNAQVTISKSGDDYTISVSGVNIFGEEDEQLVLIKKSATFSYTGGAVNMTDLKSEFEKIKDDEEEAEKKDSTNYATSLTLDDKTFNLDYGYWYKSVDSINNVTYFYINIFNCPYTDIWTEGDKSDLPADIHEFSIYFRAQSVYFDGLPEGNFVLSSLAAISVDRDKYLAALESDADYISSSEFYTSEFIEASDRAFISIKKEGDKFYLSFSTLEFYKVNIAASTILNDPIYVSNWGYEGNLKDINYLYEYDEEEEEGEEGEGEGEGEGARSMTKQKAKNLFIKPMFLK